MTWIALILLLTGGILKMVIDVHPWKDRGILMYDVMLYYSYLPAYFIAHDMTFEAYNPQKKPHTYWADHIYCNDGPTGLKYTKMTMGMAIMYSPFFFTAHALAGKLGYEADGFTLPYKVAIAFSGLFYALLGLFFLRKVLLRFFSEKVSAFTLICIGAGTNLLYYASYESAMSHASGFCLFALFIFFSFRWMDNPKFLNTLLLGVCFTLITLVRASNMVIILLPLLYGITGKKSLTDKIRVISSQWKNLLIVGAICFILMIPQFLYWKLVSGHYIFYAYGGEHFFFSHPFLLKGYFGYRKGWLLYTPMMIFSFAGLFFLWKKIPALFLPTILFIILNSWIVLSWWCWWYGGSFGLRAFIESYALLAIPFACFVDFAFRKVWSSIVFILPAAFLIFLNNFQSDQASTALIHYDSMSKALYWKVFLTNQWPADYNKLLEQPDFGKASQGIPEDK